MKVLCVLAFLMVATVAYGQRQTCIDKSKIKTAIEAAGCNPTPAPGATEGGDGEEGGFLQKLADKWNQMKATWDCLMKAKNVRDANDATIVANLKTVVSEVAVSDEKAKVVNDAIDACVTEKGYADPVPEANRKDLIKCVFGKVIKGGQCKGEGGRGGGRHGRRSTTPASA